MLKGSAQTTDYYQRLEEPDGMDKNLGKLARSSRLVAELTDATTYLDKNAPDELIGLLQCALVEALRWELQIKVDYGIVSLPIELLP